MAEKGRDQELTAFQQVYSALKDLDVETRGRVISSVLAMLGTSQTTFPNPAPQMSQPAQTQPVEPSAFPSSGRPLSLIELMQQKNPGTNGQKIALFAYYREKYEGLSRFSRDDLKSYFATAKQQPSANYDRDFNKAVRKGWIHENGADSYLTSKGVEAVEGSFPGERRYSKSAGASAKGRPRAATSRGRSARKVTKPRKRHREQ